MLATITSKGQITLPKDLREKLNLGYGDKVDFFVREDGHAEMIPVKTSLRDLKGMVTSPVSNVTLQDIDHAIAMEAVENDRD